MTEIVIDTDLCPLCGRKIIPALYALHRNNCRFKCDICGLELTGYTLRRTSLVSHADSVQHLGALNFRNISNALAPDSTAMHLARMAQDRVGSALSAGGIRFTWPTVMSQSREVKSGWALVLPAHLAPFFRSGGGVHDRGMYYRNVEREILREVPDCIRLGKLNPQAEALIIQWDAWRPS